MTSTGWSAPSVTIWSRPTPPATTPQNVEQYIALAPKEAQSHLRTMRACLRRAAPEAREGIKWGMPAFFARRVLFTFGARKGHIGFHPTPAVVAVFEEALAAYETTPRTITFPLDRALPLSLISEIAACRIEESGGA